MRPPPLITPNQSTGRRLLVSFIVGMAAFEFVAKVLVAIDTMRFERLLTMLPTALLLFFLWRGSRVAWWIAIVCVAATIGYVAAHASTDPWFSALALAMLAAQLTLLALPPTRDFLAFQREKNA